MVNLKSPGGNDIVFYPDSLHATGLRGQSIMEVSVHINLGLHALCGGKGVCGKCRVRMAKGFEHLNEPTPWERHHLSIGELNANWRLACQAVIREMGGIEVEVPPTSKIGVQRLQVEGVRLDIPIDPLFKSTSLEEPMLGLALDVGTTKIAGWIVDLRTGEILGVSACMNPQIPFGEDIISRISFANQNTEQLNRLHQAITEGIDIVFQDALQQAQVLPKHIHFVTVVGNTAMHHFALGYPVKSLSLSPFSPYDSKPVDTTPKIIGMTLAADTQVHFPPVIAGFVGSDPLMGVLSTNMHKSKNLQLLVDVGTNTELILGNDAGLVAASCASGPAFEGAHILHGMRATDGAIESVRINPKSFHVQVKTINNELPRGICGSGIVDALAELLLAGLINNRGAFTEEARNRGMVGKKGGESEFVLIPKEQAGVPNDITILQKDIREVQLAKGAIFSGIAVLLRYLKQSFKDIERVFVAGAFGSFIDPYRAQVIGLFPELDSAKFEIIGNAAGTGARMVLLSKSLRKEAINLARQIRYVELAESPWFKEEFTDAMFLPHRKKDLFPHLSQRIHIP